MDIRIVILQRGWVMVGIFSKKGSACTLKKASVLRRWGTSKGLGELAKLGPLSATVLDPTNGEVEFHELTAIATIKCEEKAWSKELK